MAPHVKSKRTTLKQKYKAQKKVRQHHREVRRANRHKPEVRKIKKKDPGIPNLWPFKQQMLEAMERKKQADAENRKALSAARSAAADAARAAGIDPAVAEVVAQARLRNREFEAREAADGGGPAGSAAEGDGAASDAGADASGAPVDSSRRAFMREFKKVMESADVIIEVLDARDPLGCRCFAAEKAVLAASGGTKRIVLVLNKVDMVPKEVTDKWLAYLRNDFPTVPFRASVQEGRGKGQANMSAVAAASVNTSECLGANNLLSLLKNYSRSKNLKTSVTVGVIGYPNVGKSSLINSLKRARVVNAGAMPGVTRTAQEVHLDKNIRLIDCPGIVFSNKQDEALVLRNCIKVESLLDPIRPIETILKRVGHEPLMAAYGLPAFKNVTEMLACLCSMRGKYRRGGAYDVEAAARVVLQDWNCGNIPFYTLPPKGARAAHLGASVVEKWGKEFDMEALAKNEGAQLSSLQMTARQKASFAAADGISPEKMQDEDTMNDDEGEDEVPKLVPAEDTGEKPSYHVAKPAAASSSTMQE